MTIHVIRTRPFALITRIFDSKIVTFSYIKRMATPAPILARTIPIVQMRFVNRLSEKSRKTFLCFHRMSSHDTYSSRSLHVGSVQFAGHNKWSKIKRPKMSADLERSKQTAKLCSEITSAVRQGGENPDFNLRLSSALSRAKSAEMPKGTIENAINSGKLKLSGGVFADCVIYEGRGPSGYSFIIEAITDNRNRTRPEIKNLLSKHGAVLGETGSVSFQFDLKGVIQVSKESLHEYGSALEIAIHIGAEDVKCVECEGQEGKGDYYVFLCDVQDLTKVTMGAKDEGLDVIQSTLEYIPNSTVSLSREALSNAKHLVTLLRNHVDVTRIYVNFEDNK